MRCVYMGGQYGRVSSDPLAGSGHSREGSSCCGESPPTHTTNMLLWVYSLVVRSGGGALFGSQKIWLLDLKNLGADWGVRSRMIVDFPK